jgi:hypothetical protein
MNLNVAFQQWVVQFVIAVFLTGGVAVLAVGVGLIVASDKTLRLIATMNRWVSTRRAFRAIEVPRDTSRAVQKYRRWLAVIIAVGAAYAVYGLGTKFDARAVGILLGLTTHSIVISWLIEAGRWALIVGNLVAMVIAIMLGFFPDALAALEIRGGRWYSDRQLIKGADTMHVTLDDWVAASPRTAGWIITVAALILLGVFAFVLPVLR